MNNHYFITGGYKWSIDRDWHFYPTIMIKAMYPAPATFDVNLRLMYSDFAWVGITYRNGDIRNLFEGDAVSFMAEYVFNDTFEVGYAYDYGVSQLNAYNDGTHEIILGIRWNDPKKEVRCPAKFWYHHPGATAPTAARERTPAEWSLRWIWNRPEVTVILSGMNDDAHIDENIRIASVAEPNSLTKAELALVDEATDEFRRVMKVGCTACQYCMPCPAGVNIPACFEAYNSHHVFKDKLARRLMGKM